MSLFVTGTDTGCGKTYVSAGLVAAYARRGLRAVGMKPVASGATPGADGELLNEDVAALAGAASVVLPRVMINPYCMELPASPHLAAAAAGVTIMPARLLTAYQQCRAAADVVIVEGVGGWCVPLAADLWVADLVRLLDLPVLLVVGVRLGCINHALLSVRQMERDGCAPCAWVANLREPGLVARDGVIATLTAHIPAPLAAVLDCRDRASAAFDPAAFDALAKMLDGIVPTAEA